MVLLWLLLLAVFPANAEAAAWRMPVPRAGVAGVFRYDRAHPFAAGWRRGVDLRSRPGARVGAACAGTVTYAGWAGFGVRRGRDVTIRCGSLAATHLGLGAVAVRRGTKVAAGARIGVVGATGVVRLGARRIADRWGWVDPLALVGGTRRPVVVPLGRAPRGLSAPRGLRAPRPLPMARLPALRRVPPVGVGARPIAVPRGAGRGRPVDPLAILVGTGLVLLALGVPLHGAIWRRRHGWTTDRPASAERRHG